MAAEKKKDIVKEVKEAIKKEKEGPDKQVAPTKQYELIEKAIAETKSEKVKKELEKEKTKAIIKGKPIAEFYLEYDSMGEGLESTYYWMLEFLQGLGYKVSKADEYFAASAGSAWFSEMGMRRQAMEKRATELMGGINMVIKSIVNLLWDLHELEIRLDMYKAAKSAETDELKNDAERQLKAMWLSDVDMKRQVGSINYLAQQAGFATLRPLFMYIDTRKDKASVSQQVKDADTTDTVRHILGPKLQDYMSWKERSEEEIQKRFDIEKTYAKSQVNSLQLYTRWVKPYLIASNKLIPQMEGVIDEEEIVTAFNVMRIYLELWAQKDDVGKDTKRGPIELEPDDKKSGVIEVVFVYRSVPGAVGQQGQYIHSGRFKIYIKSYCLSAKMMAEYKKAEEDALLSFVTGATKDTLDAIDKDLKHYKLLGGEEEKDEEEKEEESKGPVPPWTPVFWEGMKPIVESVKGIAHPFKLAYEGAKKVMGVDKTRDEKQYQWDLLRVKATAEKKVKEDCKLVYTVYKKTHGMYAI